MPRLDNSNPVVLEAFGIEYDPADPGATEPVYVCWACAYDFVFQGVDAELEYPSYGEDDYRCRECDDLLGYFKNLYQ